MTASTPRINGKWYYTLARVPLFYVCTVIVLIVFSGITKGIGPKIAGQVSILLSAIFTFLLVWIFTRWEKLRPSDVGVVPSYKSTSRFAIGFGIGFLMAISQAMIVLLSGHLQLKLVNGITADEILLQLVLYLLVACREELVFRSFFLRSLNYSLNPALALIIMNAVFIVEHVPGGMTWQMAVLGSGSGGFLFGLAALKTKGLALPLGLHSAWNFGQWSFGFKNKPGIWEAITAQGHEAKVQNIGLAAFLFVFGVAISGICIFYRKKKLK